MYRRVIVFSKTLFLSLAALLLLTGVSAFAQAIAPQLVPYNITAIAGNTQSAVPGYGGEGVPGLSATLNAPNALAVDSAGNVYIADQSNALIREWNPRTNIIKTIAGIAPTTCSGTTCTTITSGCSDGVSAYGNPVGSRMQGLVVDGFGNVYFSDYNYQGVWVIYRGGASVANFIALVDSGTVSSASAVQPGYIYHIAGTAKPTAGGCTSSSGAVSNVLATSAKLHDPLQMGIDAAGNLYFQEYGNNIVSVINTQSTPQVILGVTVPPGFVAPVVGCNATLTTPCPSSVPPWGSPARSALYNVLAGMTTDQYGNVYQVNTKGATGSIYGGVAYSGGNTLAHLLNLEGEPSAVAGGWYQVVNNINSTYQTGYNNSVTPVTSIALEPAIQANGANNIALRPASIAVDPQGNVYMEDTHWLTIYRVDANSQMATRLLPGSGNSGLVAPAGKIGSPVYCTAAATSGPTTFDAYGDGCSVQQAKMSTAGTGYITFDSAGNLYFSDTGDNIVREISIGNKFASTNLGSSLSQTIQMHFDPSNLPATDDINSFKVLGAGADFSVSSVNCANYTIRDTSIECYITVTFTPTAVGTRNATLQATSASGNYDFALTGIGSGAQIAVDGGAPSTVAVSGLGGATSVAIGPQGNLYAADPTNNRIIKTPLAGGPTTTVGSGFKAPQGVAVDPSGNVYVSDTGNNRIVEVAALTGTQTVLSAGLNSSIPLNSPHGIAVDANGTVYVADTGNSRVVEISPFGELAPVPMLEFSGAQTFVSPVGIAVDTTGNIYVADSGNSNGIIEIAPGGGDLQLPTGGTSIDPSTSLISFGTISINKPTGVAVDAAGNLYVSDGASNTVQELPSGTGPGSEPFSLGFAGLSSPGGLALDASNNLYVADTGNDRIVYENRTDVSVNFGTVPQFEPAFTVPLTVSNIGTSPLTPISPFASVSGATADFSESDTCSASNFPLGTLTSGLHCALTVGLLPVVNGLLSGAVNVQGGAASVSMTGVGENPLVTITMALSSPANGLLNGSSDTINLTATQPNGSTAPTGKIIFNYTINGVAQTPVTTNLSTVGSTATTSLTLNNLLEGRTYTITAQYSGDLNSSLTNATPLTFVVPGLPLTVVSSSVSYIYGSTVPALTGTVSGILPADQAGITISFMSNATSSSPVGTYPITAVLTGGNSANYAVPTALTSAGVPATVTENKAPLTIVVPNFTEAYGAPDVPYGPPATTETGLVNGDSPTYVFSPAHSSTQPVGTYSIVPTLAIKSPGYDKINNYSVKITNGTLVVNKVTPVITVSQRATSTLPANIAGASITVTVLPQATYYGTPTGTLTMTDTFTPITATGTGSVVVNAPVTLTLTPVFTSGTVPVGTATYTPTDTTLGTHVYTFSYSGDSNFTVADTTSSPSSLIVDQADYTVTSTTSPILIVPGIVPGGDATVAGEQTATPEQATIYVTPILASTATVNLTCSVPATYLTCVLSPASVTLTGKTTVLTSTISVSTPATLPVNYKSSISGTSSRIALAFLPLGLLTLFSVGRKRRKLAQVLVAIVVFGLLFTAGGCGGSNLVKFFTPVPAGPASVVVTGTSGTTSRSFTIPINIQ